MRTVGAYEAKTHLAELLDEVERGSIVTIARHGRPVALLVPANPPRAEGSSADRGDQRLRSSAHSGRLGDRRDDLRGPAMSPVCVLDCSEAMSWLFADEPDARSDALLESVAPKGAVVPQLWLLEVANVLAVAVRKSRLLAPDAVRAAEELEVEAPEPTWRALRTFETHSCDFADALIGTVNRERGAESTFTFDRVAAAGDLFTLVPEA